LTVKALLNNSLATVSICKPYHMIVYEPLYEFNYVNNKISMLLWITELKQLFPI